MTSTARRRPTGRRAGDSGTRDAILDAALRLFAAQGFEATSLRAIAAEAGVDAALIRHFFGDKESLFATVVTDRTEYPAHLATATVADRSTAGRAFTEAYLGLWEDPATRPVLLALVRSATTSPHAARMLREFLGRLMPSLLGPGDEHVERVALAGSHLLGVAVARHVVAVPPIAALTHDALVDELAPTIQRYLDGTHR